jgi:hypothetical protein
VVGGYPHPGCAEFGPPDEWRCNGPAVKVAEITDKQYEFTGWLRMCQHHLDEFVEYGDDGYTTYKLEEMPA